MWLLQAALFSSILSLCRASSIVSGFAKNTVDWDEVGDIQFHFDRLNFRRLAGDLVPTVTPVAIDPVVQPTDEPHPVVHPTHPPQPAPHPTHPPYPVVHPTYRPQPGNHPVLPDANKMPGKGKGVGKGTGKAGLKDAGKHGKGKGVGKSSGKAGLKNAGKDGKSGKGKSGKGGPGRGPDVPKGSYGGGDLNFAVLMDEMAYSKEPQDIGTKFAYSGKLMTEDEHVGSSSGQCIIDSAVNVESASCDFYLEFYTESGGHGMITLSGSTDQVGGYMWVTGSAGDLPQTSKEGRAWIDFDPAGNAIFYVLLKFE